MVDSSTNLQARKQSVLIAGGTGLVGTRLSKLLSEDGYEVAHLSRNPTNEPHKSYHWDVKKGEVDKEAIKNADVIIHLAGASVAGKRWTENWKKEIYDSRIDSTRLLVEAIRNHNSRLSHFIGASAIGYYGWDSGEKMVNEESKKGEGFLADVVNDWESEIMKLDDIGVKNTVVRIGIVLSEHGGALPEMSKPIKMFAGAALGSGKQYMSWIHIDDLCQMFKHLIEQGSEGIFNGVGPQPTTNKEFTKELAGLLGRPLFLPNVPSPVLRLIVGQMATILVGGNRVSSKKIEDAGFNFEYTSLHSALKNLIVK